MRFACDSCGAQYMIADEKVGARGVKVKCKKCGNMIVVKPAPEAAAAAAASAPSATADMGVSAGTSSFGGSAPAPQGELGGAFNSMFGSGAPAPESSPFGGGYDAGNAGGESAPAESNGNGAYANGNGNGGSDTAFGFQSSFGAGGGGETDIALGSLERQQQTPASTVDRGGERVWYVAIEDAQVGPVNLAEVEERWDAKEVDEDTLVWKAGMADWIPLVDVAELAYMITERPQARVSRPAMAAGASMSPGASLQASSFGSPAEMGDEPSWKPSAASALSSLVQEELVAKKPEAEAPSTPKGMEGLGIPNLGASDIFGSGAAQAGTPITVGNPTGAQPAIDPYAGGSPAWSVPSARRNGMGTGSKIGIALFVVLAIGGLAYGGYAFLQTSTQAQQAQAAKAEALLKQFQEEKRLAEVEREKRELEARNAPPVAPPAPVYAPPVAAPVDAHAGKTKGSRDKGEKDGDEKTEKTAKGGDKKPGKDPDPLADIDKAAEVKASLDKNDIVEGVKKNAANLGPCVTAARTKEEIQPGRVQFVLDWVINPNGAVTSPRLKGPQEVMSTSLPSCFARVMGSWKFAPSKQGAPISNFPLPINVH